MRSARRYPQRQCFAGVHVGSASPGNIEHMCHISAAVIGHHFSIQASRRVSGLELTSSSIPYDLPSFRSDLTGSTRFVVQAAESIDTIERVLLLRESIDALEDHPGPPTVAIALPATSKLGSVSLFQQVGVVQSTPTSSELSNSDPDRPSAHHL